MATTVISERCAPPPPDPDSMPCWSEIRRAPIVCSSTCCCRAFQMQRRSATYTHNGKRARAHVENRETAAEQERRLKENSSGTAELSETSFGLMKKQCIWRHIQCAMKQLNLLPSPRPPISPHPPTHTSYAHNPPPHTPPRPERTFRGSKQHLLSERVRLFC